MTPLPPGVDFVIVAGPTAVGKTAVAVELALEIGAEIISADSMQVYSELQIGTARPQSEELRGVPYHLTGFVSPDDQYSAGRFERDARIQLEALNEKQTPAIFCGGTGLYLKALLYGLLNEGEVNHELRNSLYQRAETEGLQSLYDKLLKLDPASSRIDPNDKIRVIRALEISLETSQPASTLQTQHRMPPRFQAHYFVLMLERETLYHRINARAETMLAAGLLNEVTDYLDKGFSTDNPAFKAVGYTELAAALRGEISIDSAMEILKRKSRRYAKRQLTWFRSVPTAEFIKCDDLSPAEIARLITRKMWTPNK